MTPPEAGRGPEGGRVQLPRPERLLPLACLAAAACLFASELMTMFEFTPPGGEPLASQSAADRHHYAPAVLAVFATAALVIALAWASKPAATAIAVAGLSSLLIFLLGDLPDANNVGTLDDPRQSFFDAKAVPQPGFWLEMIGALGLSLTGAALATLTSEQLAGLRPRWLPAAGVRDRRRPEHDRRAHPSEPGPAERAERRRARRAATRRGDHP